MESGGGPLGLIVPVTLHTVCPTHPPVLERHTRGDQRQQLRRIESSPRLLGDPEHLPDDGLGPFDSLIATRGVRAEPDGREGRLHNVRRSEMNPVFFGEGTERDHPVPIPQQRVDGLGIRLAVQADEGIALSRTLGLRLRIGHGLEHLAMDEAPMLFHWDMKLGDELKE
jgi:hypothetical protein